MTNIAGGLIRLGFMPLVDFIVQDNLDGAGAYIAQWLSSRPQPSMAEIDAAAAAAPEPVEPVPEISKAQCLLWLLDLGKTEADVAAAIAAFPDQAARARAEIEWKYRATFNITNPLFSALAPALGIDPTSLPDAFRAAALL